MRELSNQEMKNRKKIAVLGSKGFLGSELYERFQAYYDVHEINRLNYKSKQDEKFDIFINANGNSKRYWANNNVLEDFKASTVSVYETFLHFKFEHYIYISSCFVYGSYDNLSNESVAIDVKNLCPYGLHKYISELVVKKYASKYLILRCSAIIGKNMKKGAFKDSIDGRALFIALNSELQFISTSEVANILIKFINNNIYNEIFNVGGIGTVSFDYLKKALKGKFTIRKEAKKQICEMNVTKLKLKNKLFSIKKSIEYVEEYLNKQR